MLGFAESASDAGATGASMLVFLSQGQGKHFTNHNKINKTNAVTLSDCSSFLPFPCNYSKHEAKTALSSESCFLDTRTCSSRTGKSHLY